MTEGTWLGFDLSISCMQVNIATVFEYFTCFCTVHCDVILKRKTTKGTFFKLMF